MSLRVLRDSVMRCCVGRWVATNGAVCNGMRDGGMS